MVAVGAIAAVAFYFDPLTGGETEDRAYELTPALIGVPVLLSPYIALAIWAKRLPSPPRYSCLALLVLASAVLFAAARADAQGGLMAVWALPLMGVAATAYVGLIARLQSAGIRRELRASHSPLP